MVGPPPQLGPLPQRGRALAQERNPKPELFRGQGPLPRRGRTLALPTVMIGPIALLGLGVAIGAALDGAAGAVAGLLIGLVLALLVPIGALIWVDQVGRRLPEDQARALAPCPPGFRALCEFVYRRRL